jgi:cell division protein FtsQ
LPALLARAYLGTVTAAAPLSPTRPPRASTATLPRRPIRPRRPRRGNRKRPPPLWRRLPGPRAIGRGLGRALRRAAPVLCAAALTAALGGAGFLGYTWLTTSPRFAVGEVEVRGATALDPEYVRARLGLDGSENVFLLELASLQAALEQDPWIAAARVRRQRPAQVVVELREHRPAALVELGGLYLVDEDGAVFKRANPARGEGVGPAGRTLPIITGIAREEYVRAPAEATARIAWALQAAAIYARSGDRPALAEIHLDRRRGLTFVTYEQALAIRVGDVSALTVSEGLRAAGLPALALSQRLRAFDAAWAALAPDERDAARIVFANNTTRPDRVTVGFLAN